MSYLRCTHCGAKALSAASQCPRCTRPFDLHDARGMRVALRPCRGCGYMHRVDQSCASCGDVAPRLRVNVAWARRAAAVGMALTVAGAAWRLGPYGEGTGRTAASERPTVQAPASRLETARTAPGSAPTAARELAEPGLDVPPAVPEPAAVVASTLAAADSIAWVPAVARTWVNVRSDASRGGEVIGVIKPSSRAMLGTNRAGWRQVRSPDAVGWVDPRLFEADSTRPRGE